MKVYQVKIEMKGSEPHIWRRVLVAANTDFQELHQVIQHVFHFRDNHVYMFSLLDHNLKVTTDEETLEVYGEYLANREQIEKTLGALATPFAKEQLAKYRTEVQRPDGLFIEPYVEPGICFEYVYDFKAQWEMVLTIEGTLEDYALNHPVLLAGEGAAPPEKIGGLQDFQDFLVAYQNPDHPDHKGARQWGLQEGFTDYNGEAIQERLKVWRG